MGSKKVNSFLNSYACLYLPLSSNIKLREKLNKLFDNQVRTGRIFEIMDSVAGLVSYQHCYGSISGQVKNPMICVTGSIESFYMFEKIDIKKDMNIEGYLNSVGKTSMEIEINVQQEGKLKATSIFTMIARNAENHS
jgi:acyl-coenzyme A thioesterase 9